MKLFCKIILMSLTIIFGSLKKSNGQTSQVSITPGLGTQGIKSSYTVNNFSLNILGGNNGGVNGVELSGLFSVIHKNVRYVQVAGLFNKVNGNVSGVQLGGIFNLASGFCGVQIGGLYNQTTITRGIQIGGLSNQARELRGVQVAGLLNKTYNLNGIQMAGLFNKSDLFQGFQMAGIANLTRKFKGFQIGIVNISDTLEGYSMGLVNISRGGYHKVSLSMNEMGMNLLSFKSGNPKLYNIIIGGLQLNPHEQEYSFGYGLGSDLSIAKRFIFINPELISSYLYNGDWKKKNIASRLQLNLKGKISKSVSVYAGPAFTVLYSKPGVVPDNYKVDLSNGLHNIKFNNQVSGWFGWNVGIDFF